MIEAFKRAEKAQEEREKRLSQLKYKGKSIFEDIWKEIHKFKNKALSKRR